MSIPPKNRKRWFRRNEFRIDGEAVFLRLTCRGEVVEAIIDRTDLERVLSFARWGAMRAKHTTYAFAYVRQGAKRQGFMLHRLLTGAGPGSDVDHINRDGLDCRRVNMRLTTRKENSQNRAVKGGGKSGYRNVSWNSQLQQWIVTVIVDKKGHHGGCFHDLLEAAAAASELRCRLHSHGPENTAEVPTHGNS